MFIHIGSDKMVLTKDIIMILDKSAILAKDTSEFLQVAREEGFVYDDDGKMWQNMHEDKKTAIIMDKKVLFSPISSVTLSKRADFMNKLR
ncbi:MAG TPA: DUF370 domain-containing protein [Thermoanaerobacterales bacterium]|nr:DUF370 domain-containing protein [Thermoanaerobacterales bacterium]